MSESEEWVRTSERVPKQHMEVLAFWDGVIAVSIFLTEHAWKRNGVDWVTSPPSHWKPLPAPPEDW